MQIRYKDYKFGQVRCLYDCLPLALAHALLPSLKSMKADVFHGFLLFSFPWGFFKTSPTLGAFPDRVQALNLQFCVSIACTVQWSQWAFSKYHWWITFVSASSWCYYTVIMSDNVFACYRGPSEFIMPRLSHRTSYKQ